MPPKVESAEQKDIRYAKDAQIRSRRKFNRIACETKPLSDDIIQVKQVVAYAFPLGVTHVTSATGWGDVADRTISPSSISSFDVIDPDHIDQHRENQSAGGFTGSTESEKLEGLVIQKMGELYHAMLEQNKIGTPSVFLPDPHKFQTDDTFSKKVSHGVFNGLLYGNGDIRDTDKETGTSMFDKEFAPLWATKFGQNGETDYMSLMVQKGVHVYNAEAQQPEEQNQQQQQQQQQQGQSSDSNTGRGRRKKLTNANNPLSPENLQKFHEESMLRSGFDLNANQEQNLKERLEDKIIIIVCPIPKKKPSNTNEILNLFDSGSQNANGNSTRNSTRPSPIFDRDTLVNNGTYSPFSTNEPEGGERYYFEQAPHIAASEGLNHTSTEFMKNHNSNYVGHITVACIVDPNFEPSLAIKALMTLNIQNKKNLVVRNNRVKYSKQTEDNNYFLVDSTYKAHPKHILLKDFQIPLWNRLARAYDSIAKSSAAPDRTDTENLIRIAVNNGLVDDITHDNEEEDEFDNVTSNRTNLEDIVDSGFAGASQLFVKPENVYSLENAFRIMESYGGDVSQCRSFFNIESFPDGSESNNLQTEEEIANLQAIVKCKFDPKVCYRIPYAYFRKNSPITKGLDDKFFPWKKNNVYEFLECNIVKPLPNSTTPFHSTNARKLEELKKLRNLQSMNDMADENHLNMCQLDMPEWHYETRLETHEKLRNDFLINHPIQQAHLVGKILNDKTRVAQELKNRGHSTSNKDFDVGSITMDDVLVSLAEMQTNTTPGQAYNNLILQADRLKPIRDLVFKTLPSTNLLTAASDPSHFSHKVNPMSKILKASSFAVSENFHITNGPLKGRAAHIKRIQSFDYSQRYATYSALIRSYELLAADCMNSLIAGENPLLTDAFLAIVKYQKEKMPRIKVDHNRYDFRASAITDHLEETALLFRHCQQIATATGHCMVLWLGKNDCGRQFGFGESIRFNALTTGAGAASKTAAAKAVLKCCIPGTVNEVDNMSTKAQYLPKDISDSIWYIDEGGQIFGGSAKGGGGGDQATKIAIIKKQLGDGILTYAVFRKIPTVDGNDEDRAQWKIVTLCVSTMIINANDEVPQTDLALLSRFYHTVADRGLLNQSKVDKFLGKSDLLEFLKNTMEQSMYNNTFFSKLMRYNTPDNQLAMAELTADLKQCKLGGNKLTSEILRRFALTREGDKMISKSLPKSNIEEAMFLEQLFDNDGNPFQGLGGETTLCKSIRTHQALIFYIFKSCCIGMLPKIDITVSHIVCMIMFASFKKSNIVLKNLRIRLRIHIIVRILTIKDAILQAFGVDGCDLELDASDFTFEKLMAVKPYLCAQDVHAFYAITLLKGEFVCPYSPTILKLIGNQSALCNYPNKDEYVQEHMNEFNELLYAAETLSCDSSLEKPIMEVLQSMRDVTDISKKESCSNLSDISNNLPIQPSWLKDMENQLEYKAKTIFNPQCGIEEIGSLHKKVLRIMETYFPSVDNVCANDDERNLTQNIGGDRLRNEVEEGQSRSTTTANETGEEEEEEEEEEERGRGGKEIEENENEEYGGNDERGECDDEDGLSYDSANRRMHMTQPGSQFYNPGSFHYFLYPIIEKILCANLLPHEWFLLLQFKNLKNQVIQWKTIHVYEDGGGEGLVEGKETRTNENNNQAQEERGEGGEGENNLGGDSMADGGRFNNTSGFFAPRVNGRRKNQNDSFDTTTNNHSYGNGNNNRSNYQKITRYYDLNYTRTTKATLYDLAKSVYGLLSNVGPSLPSIYQILQEMLSQSITLTYSYNPRLTALDIKTSAGKDVQTLIAEGFILVNKTYPILVESKAAKSETYVLVAAIDYPRDFKTICEKALRSLIHRGMKPTRFIWGTMIDPSRATMDYTDITKEDIDKCNKPLVIPTGSYLSPKERSQLFSSNVEQQQELITRKKAIFAQYSKHLRRGDSSNKKPPSQLIENDEAILQALKERQSHEVIIEDDSEEEKEASPPDENLPIHDDEIEWEKQLTEISELGNSYSKSSFITIDQDGGLNQFAFERFAVNIGLPIGPHPLDPNRACWLYRKIDSFPTAKFSSEKMKTEWEKIEHREFPTLYNQRMRELFYLMTKKPKKFLYKLKYTDLPFDLVEEMLDHYSYCISRSIVLNNLKKAVDDLGGYETIFGAQDEQVRRIVRIIEEEKEVEEEPSHNQNDNLLGLNSQREDLSSVVVEQEGGEISEVEDDCENVEDVELHSHEETVTTTTNATQNSNLHNSIRKRSRDMDMEVDEVSSITNSPSKKQKLGSNSDVSGNITYDNENDDVSTDENGESGELGNVDEIDFDENDFP